MTLAWSLLKINLLPLFTFLGSFFEERSEGAEQIYWLAKFTVIPFLCKILLLLETVCLTNAMDIVLSLQHLCQIGTSVHITQSSLPAWGKTCIKVHKLAKYPGKKCQDLEKVERWLLGHEDDSLLMRNSVSCRHNNCVCKLYMHTQLQFICVLILHTWKTKGNWIDRVPSAYSNFTHLSNAHAHLTCKQNWLSSLDREKRKFLELASVIFSLAISWTRINLRAFPSKQFEPKVLSPI